MENIYLCLKFQNQSHLERSKLNFKTYSDIQDIKNQEKMAFFIMNTFIPILQC